MSYDPNLDPNLRPAPVTRRNSSFWTVWVAIAAIIVVGAFAWMQWGSRVTDPGTTASTSPMTQPAPATPAPPADSVTPATPATPAPSNGTQQ